MSTQSKNSKCLLIRNIIIYKIELFIIILKIAVERSRRDGIYWKSWRCDDTHGNNGGLHRDKYQSYIIIIQDVRLML